MLDGQIKTISWNVWGKSEMRCALFPVPKVVIINFYRLPLGRNWQEIDENIWISTTMSLDSGYYGKV